MKIGINLWIWESPFRTDRHLDLLAKVKSLGAESVEFGLEDDAVVDARALRRALDDQRLECSLIGMFGASRDLSSGDSTVRRAGMEYARRCLNIAAESGAVLFSGAVVGVGGAERLSSSEQRSRLQWAAENLHELGDIARRVDVRFCVEVLNRYESNLVNTTREACDLIELAGHSSVGIHLDTFHMNIEEGNIPGAIRMAGDKLYHLHASDSHRGAPGNGHIQWDEVAAALQQIQYSHAVVFESFSPYGRLGPLARIWRPLAESQDVLAETGLAFLNGALRSPTIQAVSPG